MDRKITFEKIYTWQGGLGAWFKSIEPKSRLQIGDTRCIAGELFYVYSKYVGPWPWLSEYNWVSVKDCHDFDDLIRFKNKVVHG